MSEATLPLLQRANDERALVNHGEAIPWTKCQ